MAFNNKPLAKEYSLAKGYLCCLESTVQGLKCHAIIYGFLGYA